MASPLTVKAALLQVLRVQPGYGLDLIERVKVLTGGRIELNTGSVYPALRDLEADGLAYHYEAGPKEPARGGRQRIFYALTPKGMQEADAYEETAALIYNLRPATGES